MDHTIALLSEFATAMRDYRQPAEHAKATRLRVADSLGCAVVGSGGHLAESLRGLCASRSLATGASVVGSSVQTTPEMAALANGTMVRFEDLNDMSLLSGGGHPSDVIAAILAAAEISDGGADILVGIALAYEILGALSAATDVRSRGWDSSAGMGLATCVGASHVLGLSREQAGHALAITATMVGPTRQVRQGELSHWKGCASAMASSHALLSTVCALAGITGPDEAIEGRYGLWSQATGKFDLELSSFDTKPMITQSAFKAFPAVYHSQSAIEAAIEARKEYNLPVEDIERISLVTYQRAYDTGASNATRWRPATRETADHSLPFVLACAFRDGDVSTRSYAPSNLEDGAIASLMSRIDIEVSPLFTSMSPACTPAEVTVRYKNGSSSRARVDVPMGHPDRPDTENLVQRKFQSLTSGLVETGQLWEACQTLERAHDVGGLMGHLARPLPWPPGSGQA